jgi:hypothetical protein
LSLRWMLRMDSVWLFSSVSLSSVKRLICDSQQHPG